MRWLSANRLRSVDIYFLPCWFGFFFENDGKNAAGQALIRRLHVGLIPCFPVRISWWTKASQ